MRLRWMVRLLPFFLLPALLAGVALWPESAAAEGAVHSEHSAAACASHGSIAIPADVDPSDRDEPHLAQAPRGSRHIGDVWRRVRSGVLLLVTHTGVLIVPQWTPLPTIVAIAPARPESFSRAAFSRPPPRLHA